MRTEDILKDGETVRVPMQMMDSADDPRDAYVRRVSDAWRGPVETTPVAAAATRGDRDAALAQRDARLRDAWKGGAS
jgi:hypothetical protein